MGRIKSTMVKRAAEQLMNQNSGFSHKFEDNKKKLRGLMPSKSVRNKIAGYIGRLVKAEKAKQAKQDLLVQKSASN